MAEYTATIRWQRTEDANFLDSRYSRSHTWAFDGGVEVPASSSPHVVPVPLSNPNAVDPEEAFVASLSSCHMLWFLSIAAKRGFVVHSYEDAATGVMGKDSAGKVAMTIVTLSPRAVFAGDTQPTATEVEDMHHLAHDSCYIASSVRSDVRCRPIVHTP